MKMFIWLMSIFIASFIKTIFEVNGFRPGGFGVFILYATAFSIAAALCSYIDDKKKKQNSQIVTDNDKFKNNDSFMKWIHGSTQSQQSYSTSEKQIESINEETSKNKGDRMEESEASTENELNVCKKCGEKLPINATFCSKCGKKVCKKERKPLTKRKKIILFTGCLLFCICAVTGSGIIGYFYGNHTGYNTGYNIGYNSGYDRGKEIGIDVGRYKGYRQGVANTKEQQSSKSVVTNNSESSNWKDSAKYILDKNNYLSDNDSETKARACEEPGCDATLTSSSAFYCSLHKCKYNSCENAKFADCEFCRRHKCREALCYEPRASDDTEYCTIHKCHAQNCDLRASYDSLYCITHKN